MQLINKKNIRGLTVMEMLIGLAFLLVLTAFLAPNLQNGFGSRDMQNALEGFNKHIELARISARRQQSEITVEFNQDLRAKTHSISFTLPGDSGLQPVSKTYEFPEGVRLYSWPATVRIDSMGEVEWVTQIELSSEKNRLLSERFLLE